MVFFQLMEPQDTYSLLDRDMQLHLLMRAMTSLRVKPKDINDSMIMKVLLKLQFNRKEIEMN